MKNLIHILLFVLLTSVACKRQVCHNAGFENKMKQCIATIEEYNKGKMLDTDSLYYILGYLSVITSHQTQMYLGDANFYMERKQFRTDIRKWKKWVRKNKCLYTVDQADKIFLKKINE